MCGPATVATTFASMPKWLSASSSCADDLLLARGVGLRLLGAGALEHLGLGQPPVDVLGLDGRRRKLVRLLLDDDVLRVGLLDGDSAARARRGSGSRTSTCVACTIGSVSSGSGGRNSAGISRGAWRGLARRSSASVRRSARVVSAVTVAVARTTPAIDAPVSSSSAATNRNIARMCAPTLPIRFDEP